MNCIFRVLSFKSSQGVPEKDHFYPQDVFILQNVQKFFRNIFVVILWVPGSFGRIYIHSFASKIGLYFQDNQRTGPEICLGEFFIF